MCLSGCWPQALRKLGIGISANQSEASTPGLLIGVSGAGLGRGGGLAARGAQQPVWSAFRFPAPCVPGARVGQGRAGDALERRREGGGLPVWGRFV